MPEWLMGGLGTAVAAALGFLTLVATRKSGDRQRIDSLEARLSKVEGVSRWQSDYIILLRDHISDEKGPPAPPYPNYE